MIIHLWFHTALDVAVEADESEHARERKLAHDEPLDAIAGVGARVAIENVAFEAATPQLGVYRITSLIP